MTNSRILIAPLNWGLGHASRCIPIIQQLIDMKKEVILAGDGLCIELLKKEFPALESVNFPDYPIRYPEKGNMSVFFLKQIRKLKRHLAHENRFLADLIEDRNIDAVISDNRYGLYNKNLPCILITHQLNIPSKFFRKFVNQRIHNYINRFNQCWIPDFSGIDSLAGEISKSKNIKTSLTYLGPISRFNKKDKKKNYTVCAILSGPEPQRNYFETQIIKALESVNGKHILIRGIPGSPNLQVSAVKNIEIFNLLTGKEINELIDQSQYIVSRSGYSSLMDYAVKGRKAIIIPTPGQYEQEYLAEYQKSKSQFVVQYQNQIDINKGIAQLDNMPDPNHLNPDNKLKNVLEDFCESLY